MPNGSGYSSPLIGTSIPEWLYEFDVAKELGVKVEELDNCDSVWVSRAKVKIRVENSVQNGHFKPAGEQSNGNGT